MDSPSNNNTGGPLTRQELKTVIERSLGPKVNIIDYHVQEYSAVSLGFLGAHQNLVVQVSRDGSESEETHTYFLKCVPYHKESQAKYIKDHKVFDTEMNFYNLILPELMKSSKDKSWAATCYLAKEDALVLENLQSKNYTMRGSFLDIASLKAALTSLAKMHAASLLVEKRLNKTFVELYPQLMNGNLVIQENIFTTWLRTEVRRPVAVAKKLALDHTVVRKLWNSVIEKMLPSRSRKNVFCHGDARSNNFMFTADSKCVLVDFQLVRYTPPMVDVAQLIYLNARRELRNKCEAELLKHYHSVLSDVLVGGGITDFPDFDDMLEEYEEMRIVGIVAMNFYFPTIHIPVQKQLEMTNDPDGFDNIVRRDPVKLASELMELDEDYRKLLTSAVIELLDMSKGFSI